MKTSDPDLNYVLNSFGSFTKSILEKIRTNRVRKKHDEQLIERLTTHVELLSDELEQIVPRDSPMFLLLLTMAMERKVQKQAPGEPEFKSFIDEGFPNGW